MTSTILNAVVTDPINLSAQPSEAKEKRHHNQNGTGFVNPWPSYKEWGAFEILRKIIGMRLTGKWKDPDTTPPTVPVHKPNFLKTRDTERLRATWLGHACYHVEFPGGFRVLFDPVFTDRCSPFSFLGPKRYTEMPCQIEEIPSVDAVVISHSHYDHLSHPTVLRIKEKFKSVHFFVPLGNKAWFNKLGIANCTEMDWWEEKTITLSSKGVPKVEEAESPFSDASAVEDITATVGCLPCQHTSGRTPFDRARTLWSSWSITSGGKKIWFGGDTGYRTVPETSEWDYSDKYSHLPHCPAFKDIGDLRGPFDLGLIPIGAYDPRWIMSPMHANPYDSVNIFADTKCERALGIHWGTWVLTSEEVLQPPKVLKEALKWKGLKEDGVFEVIDIGESKEY
jgi:L-ascorbate metabolism protein UlaG (beta-lactamase superfamily)